MNDTVTIKLPRRLAVYLSSILAEHHDCGPEGEGWQSDDLQEIRAVLDDAIAAPVEEDS